ncbi:hypothetical protein DVR12_07005 [Chitinophaga silvatica]|uniref:GLPGLI family protein n=1 Tax=Chitinophaga silvatica TaxID=2282649 RepID=A0A3E1YEJ6_9BACT|nr:hypothetical protein [Chitinophaga silvatica]RFS24931.1 hypothetical protein DVR12_07005 [Chitinophaga silvatica]
MKKLLLCLLFLKYSIVLNAQISDFGRGVVKIKAYSYSPDQQAPDYNVTKSEKQLFNRFTYYIDGDWIQQKDEFGDDFGRTKTKSEEIATDFSFTILHPTYWIDWRAKRLYSYSISKTFIGVLDLEKDTREMFFRRIGKEDSARIIELKEDLAVMIGGKKSFKGKTVKGSDTLTFYYSKEKVPVYSPLNSFVPADFPYFVTSVRTTTTWSNTTKLGHLIFEVINTSPLPENYSDKKAPGNLPVKEIKDVMELFQDYSNN